MFWEIYESVVFPGFGGGATFVWVGCFGYAALIVFYLLVLSVTRWLRLFFASRERLRAILTVRTKY